MFEVGKKSLGLCKSAGAAITGEQLAAINSYTLSPLKGEALYVRKMRLAHNAVDRDKERFSEGLLKRFAETLPGKSLLLGHQWGPPGKGLFFDAVIEEMSLQEAKAVTGEDLVLPETMDRVKFLVSFFYMVKKPEIDGMIADIEGGVLRHVSIAFNAEKREPVKDKDGNVLYHEYRGKGEALEGSIVWLGAQPGAAITKGASPVNIQGEGEDKKKKEEKTMKEITKALGLGVDATEAEAVKAISEKASRLKFLEEVVTPLGDNVTKLAVEELLANGADGKAYRKDLVSKQVKWERLLGRVGDTDEACKAREAVLAKRSIAEIKEDLTHLEKTVREKFPTESLIEGGTPGKNRAGKEDDGRKYHFRTKKED